MSENISIDPAQTGINQLQEIADGAKKHAEDVKQALASLNSGDITKALEACKKAHKSYTDAVAKANGDYTKNVGVDGITEEKKKQLEKARDEDIQKAGEKYLKEISEKYSDVVEKFINIVSEKGQIGKKAGAFDITFEDIGSLMQMIQTVIKGEQIETSLNELSNDVKQCIQNINPNFGTREIGKIKDLARLAERSKSETSAAAQEFINNTEDADKKFREAISNIVKDYEKGVQESKKEDKKFLSTIASLQTELNKKLKEAKDSNSDSAAAQAFEEKNEARNHLLNFMKQRLEGTKFDADVMTDAILGHVGSREKLQANYEKASKSYEDFKAAMIKEDKFSGRLFKAFTHKGGFRASIKEDIRKDFENWGYGGPKNLTGLLRAKFTHWVLTRHDKRKLESSDAIDETTIYDAEIKKKIEATVAERKKIADKIKKTKDKIDNLTKADGIIAKTTNDISSESDEGKKEKLKLQLNKQNESLKLSQDELDSLKIEYIEKAKEVQARTTSAKSVGAITNDQEIQFNKPDEGMEDIVGSSIAPASKENAASEQNIKQIKVDAHGVGKKNIKDGVHLVGDDGAELLTKEGNAVSIYQIKSDTSSPASITVAPPSREKPAMESGAEFERKQQETKDRHSIAKTLETIVEVLREGNKLKKKEGEAKKEGKGGFLSGLLGMLGGLLGGKILGFLKKGIFGLGRLLLKPLMKIGTLIASSFRFLLNGIRSLFGLPKLPDVKVPKPDEAPLKGSEKPKVEGEKAKGEGEKAKASEKPKGDTKGEPKAEAKAKKGRFSGLKDAFKNFKVKDALKVGVKGLGKGLVAGIAVEVLREAVARGTAKILGLTQEEYEESRARVEDMEYGHGRTDDMLAEKTDAEAEDEQYEAYKRSSEMWYRKRCKELGVHHKTNQDSWFASSKDYRELTYDEIMALSPKEREYFNAWLHSKEGESRLAKFQREHPDVFGTPQKAKSSTPPSIPKVKPATSGPIAIAAAKAAAMRARAKNPEASTPTKEAKDAAKKMQETNLLPAGLGAAAAAAALKGGSGGSPAASGGAILPAAGLGLGLGAGIIPETPKEDTHHGSKESGIFAKIRQTFQGDKKKTETIQEILLRIDETTKAMQKDIESIYKMVRFIKVDGVTLGDMLDHPMQAGVPGQQGVQAPGVPGAGPGGGAGGPSIPGVPGAGPGGGYGGGGAPSTGKLGDAIAKFESGTEGIMKIGYDKGGGTSYGKWQLSSRQGSYQEWLGLLSSGQYGEEGKQIAERLKAVGGYNTGSRKGAAVDAYLREAAAHKELFEESQRASYTKHQYNQAFKLIKSDSLKNQIQNDKSFQEMLFSTAVQHGQGGASSIFNAVYREGMTRDQFIDAVYNERARRMSSCTRRYNEERNVIKGMSPSGPAPSASPYTPEQQAEINANPMFQGVVPGRYQSQQPQQQGGLGAAQSTFMRIARQNVQKAGNGRKGGYDQNRRLAEDAFDCSSFVGRTLNEAGLPIPKNITTVDLNPQTAMSKNGMMRKAGFTWVAGNPIKNGVQVGDILWRPGHTEIYAGNYEVIGAHNSRAGTSQYRVGPKEIGTYSGYYRFVGDQSKFGGDIQQVPEQTPAAGPIQQNQQPESVPLYNPATGEQIKEPASPAPAGGGMQQIPAQQSPAIPGMPNMKGGPVQGLSSLYANLTRDAINRHVTYGWNSKDSRSGSIDCSGWVTEMNKTALGGLSGQARTNMEAIIRGGQQGGAAGLIQSGESLGFGVSGGLLDPKLGRVKENMMIGLSIGKHAKGRHKGIGHVVQTYRDPATGELMVSESTRGKGVIATRYADWYEKWKNVGLHGVDLDAATGGAFAGGNIKGAMEGVQQPDMGQLGGQTAGPQIQGSPQAQAQQAATAYYESGGGGGGNVYAPTTNVMGGGGNAGKGGATFLTTKDPMSWIILQGNTVH